MGIHCCSPKEVVNDHRYRTILWFALAVNSLMFMVEIIAAWHAQSTSLLADSMDFMADSVNYAITLFALALSARARSKIALAKGYTMVIYGVLIVALVFLGHVETHPPIASIMGLVAGLALLANFSVAFLLFRFRSGDSNRRSVWLCTRNDSIANVAVLIAAVGVWQTHHRWPDMLVGLAIGLLGLWSGNKIIQQARAEMRA